MSLFDGLNYRSFYKRSKASESAFGKNVLKFFCFLITILPIMLGAKVASIESISNAFGFPNSYRILSIWLRVLVPGKIALPLIISPRIHPTDHISTGF